MQITGVGALPSGSYSPSTGAASAASAPIAQANSASCPQCGGNHTDHAGALASAQASGSGARGQLVDIRF